MTLRELIAAHPAQFYGQSWYLGESFLDTEIVHRAAPKSLTRPGFTPTPGNPALPCAADLAAAYLTEPDSPAWRFFLWTRDTDRHGNPVYVGGVGHDDAPGFQIHRHLTITDRWRVPA